MYLILFCWLLCLGAPVVWAANKAPAVAVSTPSNSTNNIVLQSTDMDSIIKSYLLKHPEVLVESLESYQKQQMESMKKIFDQTQDLSVKYADELFHQSNDPVLGNATGNIALVEFSDYQCGHCIEAESAVHAILQANKDLKLIVKEFPIRGGLSEEAALAALAANKQGKYAEFRSALIKNSASLSTEKIYQLASAIGLNVALLKKDMASAELTDIIKSNKNLAVNLKLLGTPAVFVAKSSVTNGAKTNVVNYLPGIISQQQLQSVLNQITNGAGQK